jgi:PIN domain nuclease of toxin-antitoxin system
MTAARVARTALADPLDRLLVATAHHLNATLLTSDSRMLEYAASNKGIRAENASR